MFVFLLSSGNLTCLPRAVAASILHFFLFLFCFKYCFLRERGEGKSMCGVGDVRGGRCSQTSVRLVFGLPSVLLTGSGYSLVWLLVYKTLLSSLAHVI